MSRGQRIWGALLAPREKPFYLEEEEVPHSGVRVFRNYQFARGQDGHPHIWVKTTKGLAAKNAPAGFAGIYSDGLND